MPWRAARASYIYLLKEFLKVKPPYVDPVLSSRLCGAAASREWRMVPRVGRLAGIARCGFEFLPELLLRPRRVAFNIFNVLIEI